MIFCVTFVVLVTWNLVFNSEGSQVRRTCDSPQYLELGRPATIHCTFQGGFYSVFWYNTSDYTNNHPVIRYTNLLKSGSGYESGEFDLWTNGSLIVKNVSIKHVGIYTTAYLRNRLQDPIVTQIRVDVMAKPDISFPHILNCGSNSTACYYKGDSPVRCSVQDVRPNISLTWMARTLNEDKLILNDIIATRGTIGYTFRVITTDFFHYAPLLALLVCKASSRLKVLEKYESMILVEKRSHSFSSAKRTQRYVERGSMLELTCTYDAVAFVVWKKAVTSDGSEYKDLLYSIFVGEKHSEVYDDNITVDENGSLIVYQVDVQHEGIYLCVFGNGLTNRWITYDVKVTVHPVPAFPVVNGCDPHQYCVLEGGHQGSLQCTVNGIRPLIELQWKTFLDRDAAVISFTNQQLTVKDNGDTFDVTLTSTYNVKDKSRDRISIECTPMEEDEPFFEFTTKLDLMFVEENMPPTKQVNLPTTGTTVTWVIPVIVVLLLLVLLVGLFIAKFLCSGRHTKRTNREEEEVMPKLTVNNEWKKSGETEKLAEKQILLGDLPNSEPNSSTGDDLEGIKKQFLKEIKEKYKDLYDAVQPIPYIKDRLYCVDRVFVEGGIEFLDSYKGETKGNWKNIDSYQNVFNDQRVQSPRRILEGEPGYGKSTVTLQFAYDWCNSKNTSALKDVEIMILLRLRQMGGVSSIYRAIKQFILPKDTLLNEKDIEKIMRNCTSAVVILDGFDEYPDQDMTSPTDVMNIIARQMLQDIEVVTTTRSSFLPKKCPALTKRLRLTGFDDNARRYYIRKAVVGDDDEKRVQKVEESLQENPILSDLCQVPLLFVIFAHMTDESEQFRKLNSVTSFFRYMISCFHSHMRNKMDDENVRKYKLFESEHHNLDKVAFDALCGSSQKIVWKKEDLSQTLGQEFYDQYVGIGILVEEESVDIIDDPGTPITEHVQYKTEVRFYHKLFCEWYAAHYLSSYLQQNTDVDLSQFLQHLDPFDVQYLYRFSCGLNADSAEQIITYLKNIEGGDKFAILCILEQTGKVDHIKETIRELCSEGVIISGYDSLLLQRSSMQLLEIAARNDIPIEYVDLDNCLQSVDLSTSAIRTTSGLALTSRIPVKELMVSLFNRDMTKDEAIDILQFASMCPLLRLLVYYGSVPPLVFTNRSLLSSLKPRDVKVWWSWADDEPDYILNLQTGRWENENDGSEPTEEDCERMLSKDNEDRKGWTEETYKEWVKEDRETLRKEAEKERAKLRGEALDDEDDSDDDVSEEYSDTT